MTTFGDPYDNQYHATSVQSGKSKRAAEQNQKEARRQKKAKARGSSVDRGNKHGGYDDNKKGGRGGRGGRNGGRGGGGRGGGGGSASADFSPGFSGFIQAICLAAAIGQLCVGIIHMVNLFESLEDNCPENNPAIDCIGESLFWDYKDTDLEDSVCPITTTSLDPDGGYIYERTVCNEDNVGYTSLLNIGWRSSVFTLVPDAFVDNWTPLIFGIIAVFQCLGGFQSDWISGSMLKALLFNVVMMLFAAFGYAGQAGIIVGFIQALAGFLILIALVMKIPGYAYPTLYLCC